MTATDKHTAAIKRLIEFAIVKAEEDFEQNADRLSPAEQSQHVVHDVRMLDAWSNSTQTGGN